MIPRNTDGKPIRGLQQMLRTISNYTDDVLSVVPDGKFGQDTKDSVTSFQRAYGIEPTGEVDYSTWKKIREIYQRFLHIYSAPRKSDVVANRVNIQQGDTLLELFVIQAMLYALSEVIENIPKLVINGVHDENSVGTVIFIQEMSGLEPTGVIDTITFNMISDLYSSNVAKRLDVEI